MLRKISLFLLLLTTCNQAWSQNPSVVGYAYDVRAGTLHYIESYQNHYDRQGLLTSSEVLYETPDKSTVLATKDLRYLKHPYAPELRFSNHATQYEESIHWLDTDTILVRKKEPGEAWQERSMKISEPVVADAGFDRFLQDHIQDLLTGKTLHFQFVNPARLDWFHFSAEPMESSDATITLKVYPSNRLLRWLVDPILLTYQLPSHSDQSPQLMHYNGLTNLSLDGGAPVQANIFYEYEPEPAQQIVNLF